MSGASSPPVRLDLTNACVWRGTRAIPLRPKTLAVLRCLLAHPGQLVPKATFLETVWPDVAVSDVVLMVCIRELRRALGDNPKVPQCIETVHRLGYRWIGTLATADRPPASTPRRALASSRSPLPAVGRERELAHLHHRLAVALAGQRQVLFITGEPGLGKTTLVDAFLAERRDDQPLWIGRGQCIEHYGAGEAYLPVLEALGRLCRGTGGEELIALLGSHAPTWLMQMPGLVTHLETLHRRVVGATRERMLRELAEAIEVLTAEQPLVLVLEDLHWSDVSTLDFIASIARRQEPARLLLLGTYRPAEVAMHDHPLHAVQHELQVHGLCAELPLTLLSDMAIAQYLTMRFPETAHLTELVGLVHQRTDGNPLFMVNLVEDWLSQGWLLQVEGRWTLRVGLAELQAGMPESLRHMIETQLDRLTPQEARVLEVGSVAGIEFSAAAVAAGLRDTVVRTDDRCAAVMRRSQLLRSRGEQVWPDGTVTGCYGFAHALYQEVLYSRLTPARRVYLHGQIGRRVEAGFGSQAGDIAAELARHFEQGRDVRRTVMYLRLAAGNALRRYANREAIDHLAKGLAWLTTLPETPERAQQELDMLIALGPALMAAKGYGAPEVERTYSHALTLCQQVQETPLLFQVLGGLHRFYMLRAELSTARALGERLLTMAQHAQDPALLLVAHHRQIALAFQGEFVFARERLEEGIVFYDAQRSGSHILLYGDDPGVGCLSYIALVLWFLGYADQARQRMQAALTLARDLAHPFSLAYALIAAAWLHQYRREAQASQTYAAEAIALSREQGIALREAQGTIMGGWALAAQGEVGAGIAQMQQGLAAFHATGAVLNRTYYLFLLAEAYAQRGQTEEGLCALTEALDGVQSGRERWWEAELHRLSGDLLLAQTGTNQQLVEVEQCFRRAVGIAQQQQAKSLELRATMSLGRLWQRQGKRSEAYALLAPVYGWFTEGFDTADLQEAKTLLEELKG